MVTQAPFERARSLVLLGVNAFQDGRLAEGIRDLKTASDLFQTLVKSNPNDGRLATNLAISLGFLGSALRDSHRPVEALAAFREARTVLESKRNPSALDLYNLACDYAQLSVLLPHAPTPPPAAERDALADKAIDALRRSIAAGMKDFALIQRDHDLRPAPRPRSIQEAAVGRGSEGEDEMIPNKARDSTPSRRSAMPAVRSNFSLKGKGGRPLAGGANPGLRSCLSPGAGPCRQPRPASGTGRGAGQD